MKKIQKYILCLIILLNVSFNNSTAQSSYQKLEDDRNTGIPVLPGVSGFGLDTKGGQGGQIIKVENLNSEGKGSLAEAIDFGGPRIIVFEVAGYIDLKEKSLKIINPYITIAGQTAPSPGITIINGGLNISAHDVIIQHIKVRPGDAGRDNKSGWEMDGIASNKGAYNVIVDHCSISWATDENLSASGPRFDGKTVEEWRENTSHKITFSNCIIAQGLSHSTHSKGEHSKGTLVHDNATEILIYGNLYANNVERNPLIKGGVQAAIVNNLIYNPGNAAIHYNLSPGEWKGREWVTGKMSVEGNYIEFGSNSSERIAAANLRGPLEIYWKDNMIIKKNQKENDKAEETIFRYSNKFIEEKTTNIIDLLHENIVKSDGIEVLVEARPVWPKGLVPILASEVKEHVLSNAGAFPWDRDEIDQKIIEGVETGNGRIINSETEVGSYPEIKMVYRKFIANEWDLISLTKKAN